MCRYQHIHTPMHSYALQYLQEQFGTGWVQTIIDFFDHQKATFRSAFAAPSELPEIAKYHLTFPAHRR